VKLKSVKGNIEVSVNIDSIVSSKVTEFKQNYKNKTNIKEIEVIKFRTPLWMWGIILVEGLIIFLLIRFK
jgi:hypothetical protein